MMNAETTHINIEALSADLAAARKALESSNRSLRLYAEEWVSPEIHALHLNKRDQQIQKLKQQIQKLKQQIPKRRHRITKREYRAMLNSYRESPLTKRGRPDHLSASRASGRTLYSCEKAWFSGWHDEGYKVNRIPWAIPIYLRLFWEGNLPEHLHGGSSYPLLAPEKKAERWQIAHLIWPSGLPDTTRKIMEQQDQLIIYTVEFQNDDDSQDSMTAFGSLAEAQKCFRELKRDDEDDQWATLWLSRWTLKPLSQKKMAIGMMSSMGHVGSRRACDFASKWEILEVAGEPGGRYVGEVWRA